MEARRTHYTPDAVRAKGSDEGNCTTDTLSIIDGMVFLPSTALRLGADGESLSQMRCGLLMMHIDNEHGVYTKMTPQMMRQIGGAMLDTAEKIERYADAQAADALKKAATKPQPKSSGTAQ